jgi:oxygen-independent coproporphyrinogen III oxidase
MKVPQHLLDKYNQALPRYTSYPPANHFKEMGHDTYVELLDASNNDEPSNISIYIHIPFCHKICFYCGCNAMRHSRPQTVVDYVAALKQEIKMVKSHLAPNRKVAQIHYGGGTPNAIPVEMLASINQLLFDEFVFADDAEIAIECHPAHLYPDTLEKLVAARFNRISLGIQDFDTSVLKAVNREPSRMPVSEIIGICKSLRPDMGINLDFIYGLPYQTPESFAKTIDEAIAHNPDRIVTFSYAHVPWVKNHMYALEKMGLPTPETKMQMFEQSYQQLTQSGYIDVGMDHYAKADDELAVALKHNQLHRNFQGYCTRRTTGQVYAFGVSGISQLTGGYAQNTKNIEAYIASINKGVLPIEKGYAVNQTDKVVRDVINQIMCNRVLDWQAIGASYGLTGSDVATLAGFKAESFAPLVADDLVTLNDHGFELSDMGRFFIRNVAALLDPMLQQGTQMYSRSI